MKKAQVITLTLLLILLLVPACAPKSTPAPALTPTATTEVAPVPKGPAKETWEEEWDKVVKAAQKEGKIVVYGGLGPPVRAVLMGSIKGKYGISVEWVGGRAQELANKISAERRAKLYLVDVWMSGPSTALEYLKPAGAFDPLDSALILPEVTKPEVWWGGQLIWVDAEHCFLAYLAYPSYELGINTNLVKPGEIGSWSDLLDPKWKGKILINDPTVGGSGGKLFSALGEAIMGWDYIRQIAKQNPVLLRDQRLQIEWLAHGKYPVLMGPDSTPFTEFKRLGAPIDAATLKEGSHLTAGFGNVGLLNRAPHPNASKLFINFLLTKETQTLVSQAYGAQSARVDVPTDSLSPHTVRKPGVKYFSTMSAEFSLKSVQHRKLLEDIFGSLSK